MNRIQLLDTLEAKFNDNELRRLCFTLQVDYESLPGQGKAAKARELVLHCERLERYPELLAVVQQARPQLGKPPAADATSASASNTVFDMRGQQVEHQINSAGNYYAGSASDPAIHNKLDKILASQADLKGGQTQMLQKLDKGQRNTVEAILGQLRAMQANATDTDTELKGLLDDMRRGILFINAQQLPQMRADLREALVAVNETLSAGTDVRTGLELTVPLIPFLLDYKVSLDGGGGVDLRQVWERAQAWLAKRGA